MPDKLLDILNKFSSVSLEDIENAKLMDRTDIKFTMALENIEPLLVQAFDKYNILPDFQKHITKDYEGLNLILVKFTP